jgi:hypothetical protein
MPAAIQAVAAAAAASRGAEADHAPALARRHKEGENAVTWTRLSCHRFAANAVLLQLHALAYNLANFLRTLALPDAVKH